MASATLPNGALWMQNVSYPASADRSLIDALYADEGVVDGFAVTPSSGLTINVSAGRAVIVGDEVSNQGKYLIDSDAVVQLTVASVGADRTEYVYIAVNDTAVAGGRAGNNVTIETATSVPSDSTYVIATLTLLNGTATITAGMISDDRTIISTVPDDAITAAKIAAGAVGTTELADDAVTQAKIGPGAVGSTEIASGAVNTGQLADDGVTNAKIATDAVNADSIATGEVGTSEIADDAVTQAKIGPGAVGSTEIASSAVTNAKIGADAVNGSKIADNSIDSEHYVDGSIDAAHIGNDQINSQHYANGSIDAAHIANDQINSQHYADGSIDTAHIADNQITSPKVAAGVATRIEFCSPPTRTLNDTSTTRVVNTTYTYQFATTVGGVNLTNAVGVIMSAATKAVGPAAAKFWDHSDSEPGVSTHNMNAANEWVNNMIICSIDSARRIKYQFEADDGDGVILDVYAIIFDAAD